MKFATLVDQSLLSNAGWDDADPQNTPAAPIPNGIEFDINDWGATLSELSDDDLDQLYQVALNPVDSVAADIAIANYVNGSSLGDDPQQLKRFATVMTFPHARAAVIEAHDLGVGRRK